VRTDPRQLDGTEHDVCVVGAGIQGAAIAREAAVRGFKVLLVDRRDVGAGTSSRSSRLIHGGLRYLQQAHFGLVREALRERERLLRLCPHLVRPQPMLMPFFKDGGGSRWQLRLGTWLYSKLAAGSTLPRPRSVSAAAAAKAFPGLRQAGLRSAIEFFDASTADFRLTLANVLAAQAAGASVATHTCVEGTAPAGGLRLRDKLTDAEVTIRARRIVNATGPAADALRRLLGADGEDLVRCTRGSHLVLAERPGELALAAFLPDRRIQFVIPHGDGTLCGTTDVDDPLTGDEMGPPDADIDYLLAALRFLLDPAPTRADIRFAYSGWRSLPAKKGPAGALNREAFVVDEPIHGASLHTIVGGKLTTHRALAERVIDRLFDVDGPSPTRTTPLPGGDGPRDVTDPLWWRYGSRRRLVQAIAVSEPRWSKPLCPHRPFLAAELVHALQNEGAVTFADVMVRRLWHSQGPCRQFECLEHAHRLFLRARKWRVDADPLLAIGALLAELQILNGDFQLQIDGITN
jgi:glycerol-3-phosphate dehydrogenase